MSGIHELSVIALHFSVNLNYFKSEVCFLKKKEMKSKVSGASPI